MKSRAISNAIAAFRKPVGQGTPAMVESLEGRRLMSVTAPTVFTLNPELSTATLTGTGGIGLVAQAPMSLTACYKGTILANVGANSLQFVSGSQIIGMREFTGPVQPGNAPAAFSAVAAGLLDVAVRGVVFGITSSKMTVGAKGAFSNASENIFVEQGNIAFAGINGLSLTGKGSLVGLSATNKTTTPGHLTVSGGIETLTIPFKATITYAFSATLKSQFTFTGQLVATAKVPKAS